MPKTTKKSLFYKKESCRTRNEKVCRDIVCYGVTIFAAIMWFLLMDANANLADAESDFASNNVEMTQQLS